jgi:hypothetical protein
LKVEEPAQAATVPVAAEAVKIQEKIPSLSWEMGDSSRKSWSAKLVSVVKGEMPKLSKAKDIKRFCPKFAGMTDDKKVIVFSEVVVGMALYESSFKPDLVFREPAPLHIDSIGLLQLSYEDKAVYPFCNLDKKKNNLKDPLNNLDCGVKIFAHLINKWGYITTPANKGAAAYWSTLREKRNGLAGIISRVKTKVPGCV